jgi:hypothetical protein
MFLLPFVSTVIRNLGRPHVLAPVALAALALFAGPSQLQAGGCPPCSGDPNECAFSCCLLQDCHTWNIISCTAYCYYGYLIATSFDEGDVGPAIKSFTGQRQADCHGDNKVGVIMLPPAGSRNTTKRIEIGMVSIRDRKFATTAEDVVGVVVEVVSKREYEASGAKPRWQPIGSATFDTRAGAWVLNWPLSAYTAAEYVVRAKATRKDGRVQEARGLALSDPATY